MLCMSLDVMLDGNRELWRKIQQESRIGRARSRGGVLGRGSNFKQSGQRKAHRDVTSERGPDGSEGVISIADSSGESVPGRGTASLSEPGVFKGQRGGPCAQGQLGDRRGQGVDGAC